MMFDFMSDTRGGLNTLVYSAPGKPRHLSFMFHMLMTHKLLTTFLKTIGYMLSIHNPYFFDMVSCVRSDLVFRRP